MRNRKIFSIFTLFQPNVTMKNLDLLYKAYFNNRFKTLTPEQFEVFVLYSPPLMVVACDQVVDHDEMQYVEHFSEFIARTFRDTLPHEAAREELNQTLESEMRFLLAHIEEWELRMLEAARELLRDDQEIKQQVYELLEMFARSSEGVSQVESEKIEHICRYLSIKPPVD